MTKTLVSLLLTLALAIPAFSQKKATSGDAEFKALIQEYYAAWSTANTDRPSKLYDKDADLVFFDVAPLKYNGWDEYKVGVQKGLFDNMISGTLSANDDLKVNRRGSIVWTSVTGHLSAKMKDGKALETDIRHTAIWEKQGGKWVIVHEHVSVPMQ